jgi:predicted nucleic acid-binding protein
VILIDSNIIIDYWKKPKKDTEIIIKQNEIATCGIVIAELIHGAKNKKDIIRIIDALSPFKLIEIEKNDWFEIGNLLNKLRRNGLKVPFQDAILSYLSIKHDLFLWTKDKHFKLIKEVFSELKLY